MKSNPSLNRAASRSRGGVRPNVALLWVLTLLSALGLATEAWISRGSAAFSPFYPGVVYWARVSGLADIFHATGYVFLLALLAINLLAALVTGLPRAWRRATRAMPEAPSRGGLGLSIPTQLGPDAFRAQVMEWGRPNLGALRELSGEASSSQKVQFGSQKGRWSGMFLMLSYLSALLILGGATLGLLKSLEARAVIEEGRRVDFVELLHGNPPKEWNELERAGRVLPGFYHPGFEIECTVSARPSAPRSVFNILEGSRPVSTVALAAGVPGRFRDFEVHQTGFSRAGSQMVDLALMDRKRGVERHISRLAEGEGLDLEDFRFKVLEIKPATDLATASVEIEYQEKGHSSEKIWLFEEHRDYDFAHRKASAQNFTIDSIRRRYSTDLLISQEPGKLWVWGGLGLLVLSLLGVLYFPHRRYWMLWEPGQVRLVGWASDPTIFEPEFKRLAEQFKRRIQRGEGGRAGN